MNKKRKLVILLIVVEIALLVGLGAIYAIFRKGSCDNYMAFVTGFTDLKQIKQYDLQVRLTQALTGHMLNKPIHALQKPDYTTGVGKNYEYCQAGGSNLFLNFYNVRQGSVKVNDAELAHFTKLNPQIAEVGRFIYINVVFAIEQRMK